MKCAFIDLGKQFGGAENYLIEIVTQWVNRGNDAVILVKKDSIFEQKLLNSHLKDKVFGVSFSIKDIKYIRNLFLQSDIDELNINGINSGVFVSFLRLNKKKITTVHSNADIDRINKPLFIRKMFVSTENKLLKKSHKIIVVSSAIKELLISRGIDKKKIVVIPNGIKTINYENKNYRENSNHILKICYVGRLEKVKGCEYLIHALSKLEDKYICDIYGEGSLAAELETLSKKNNTNVYFKGFSSNIRNIFPQYDVIVIPSLYEASPLIIPEAMNAKVLLVCSNVGGIPFIIKHKENGYLFEKGNVKQLAEILTNIKNNPIEQIPIIENAYNDFLNNYTNDIMFKRTLKILEETE